MSSQMDKGKTDAKEYSVPDIIPAGGVVESETIPVEIIDRAQQPIADAGFEVSVDGGKAKPYKTDADGKFNVPKAKKNLVIRLTELP
ncbi:MAG TPA: hypothetical protein HA257_07320 [Candidatus Methanoperedenaceae archaeon]|nr:hypothetical protein [Candidatus Methanoperedenaceae archaeon]